MVEALSAPMQPKEGDAVMNYGCETAPTRRCDLPAYCPC
jgi:hypothetical protein